MTLAQFKEKHGDMIRLQFPIWSGFAARTPRVGFMAISGLLRPGGQS